MADNKADAKISITSSFNAAGVNAGKAAVERLSRSVGKSMKTVSDSAQQSVGALNAVGGAIGLIDPKAGMLVHTVSALTGCVKGLGGAFKALLANPVMLVLAGVAAAFVAVKKAADDAREKVRDLTDGMQAMFANRIAERNKEIADSYKAIARRVGEASDQLEHLRELESIRRQNGREAEDIAVSRAMRKELMGASTEDEKDAIRDRYAREKVERDAARRREDLEAASEGVMSDEKYRMYQKESQALKDKIAGIKESLADNVDAQKHALAAASQAMIEGETDDQKSANSHLSRLQKQHDELESQLAEARNALSDLKRENQQSIQKAGAMEEAFGASDAKRLDELEALDAAIAEREKKKAEDREKAAEDAAQAEQAAFVRAAQTEMREKEQMLKRAQAEEMRLDREAAAQRERLRQTELNDRIRELRKLSEEERGNASDAQSRVAAAESNLEQAWGWYRDKDSLSAQLEEEKAEALAQKQFEKDFEKLKSRKGRNWREAENLSIDEEAVRRVAIAREEKDAADKHLAAIEENTANLAAKIDELLAMKG